MTATLVEIDGLPVLDTTPMMCHVCSSRDGWNAVRVIIGVEAPTVVELRCDYCEANCWIKVHDETEGT